MRSATRWCVGGVVVALLALVLFWPRDNVLLRVKSVEPGNTPISAVAKMELVNNSRRPVQYYGYLEGAGAVQHAVVYKHPQGWVPAGGFPQPGTLPPPVKWYDLGPGESVQFNATVDPGRTWKVVVHWSKANWRGPPAFLSKLPVWVSGRLNAFGPNTANSTPVTPRNTPEKHK